MRSFFYHKVRLNSTRLRSYCVFFVLFCLWSLSHAQQIETDISTKGPFAQRYFARVLGAAMPPVADYVPPANAVDLIASKDGSNETNELIVLLNDANTALFRKMLLLRDSDTSIDTAPGLERAVVAGIKGKNANVMENFANPVQVEYLLNLGRFTDADRASRAKLRSPRERLERFILLRYASIDAARKAQVKLAKDPSVLSVMNNGTTVTSSFTPNDPYYASAGGGMPLRQYQWGLQAMNFPSAWDLVLGHSQIGMIERGWPGTYSVVGGRADIIIHPELKKNSRPQFTPWKPVFSKTGGSDNVHAMHVGGIISAESNNGVASYQPTGGITGACVNCSVSYFPYTNNTILAPAISASLATLVRGLVASSDNGVQIISWSGSYNSTEITCLTYSTDPAQQDVNAICNTLNLLAEHEVLIVESAGNFQKLASQSFFPLYLANNYPILPVAGTQSLSHDRWVYDAANGSNQAGLYGVAAPAKSIVSTINSGGILSDAPYIMCGDTLASDESGDRFGNGYGDGVGSCTGTSMSAPFVSALAGLVRSVNPLLSANQTRSIIQQSGHLAASPAANLGYGVPDAWKAVTAAIATNPRRLTPLFSFYSAERNDSFYTTVPQEGSAALDGSLRPYVWLATEAPLGSNHGVYGSAYGQNITAYPYFPRDPFSIGPSLDTSPRAEVWLFSTHVNPKSTSTPLEPVYRMSWKCGDEETPYPPAICSSVPKHIDTVLVNTSELAYFKSLGYQTDGVQGYVYPKTLAQPPGTVRLIRKYHPGRDDHAIFPETAWPTMQAQGYTANTNTTDWLGYVYPNTNGSTPTIQ